MRPRRPFVPTSGGGLGRLGTYNRVMNGLPYVSMFDVAVAGRSALGLATGLALARAGLRVAMIGPDAPGAETAPTGSGSSAGAGFATASPTDGENWDNRIFALSPSTQELLDSLGVWQAMDDTRIAPVYDMKIWPQAASSASQGGGFFRPKVLHFSAWEGRIDALAWIVENRNLTRALAQACRFAGLPTFAVPLLALDTEAEFDAAKLTLADGRVLRARLVVGADGANSLVRELAGIASNLTDYPQRAVVANFDTSSPHRDCAYQWFGEHGVLALLPLPASDKQPGRCSIVWSAPFALADELLALAPEALASRVEAVAGGILGIMKPLGVAAAWPLRLGRVDSLIGARVALVGDAAHVVHPLAGQGMNLGFGDVKALAHTMSEREPQRDPGEHMLLRRYERARAGPVAAMRLTTDGLQKLFDVDSWPSQRPFAVPVSALRHAAWQAVAGSSLIKRMLISQAIR